MSVGFTYRIKKERNPNAVLADGQPATASISRCCTCRGENGFNDPCHFAPFN